MFYFHSVTYTYTSYDGGEKKKKKKGNSITVSWFGVGNHYDQGDIQDFKVILLFDISLPQFSKCFNSDLLDCSFHWIHFWGWNNNNFSNNRLFLRYCFSPPPHNGHLVELYPSSSNHWGIQRRSEMMTVQFFHAFYFAHTDHVQILWCSSVRESARACRAC